MNVLSGGWHAFDVAAFCSLAIVTTVTTCCVNRRSAGVAPRSEEGSTPGAAVRIACGRLGWVVVREGARGKPVRVRRGPATVTGSGAAGREASHWGRPGKARRRCERKPGDLPPPEHRHRFRGMEQLVRRRARRPPGPRRGPPGRPGAARPAASTGPQDAPAAGAARGDARRDGRLRRRALLDTRVAPGQSVMRATRGATEVEHGLRGRRSWQSMLGLDSDRGGHARLVLLRQRRRRRRSAPKEVRAARRRRGLVGLPRLGRPASTARRSSGRGRRRSRRARRARAQVAADPPLAAALGEAGAPTRTAGDPAWRVTVGRQRRARSPRPGVAARAGRPGRAPGSPSTIEDGRVDRDRRPTAGRAAGARARAPLVAAVPTGTVPGRRRAAGRRRPRRRRRAGGRAQAIARRPRGRCGCATPMAFDGAGGRCRPAGGRARDRRPARARAPGAAGRRRGRDGLRRRPPAGAGRRGASGAVVLLLAAPGRAGRAGSSSAARSAA